MAKFTVYLGIIFIALGLIAYFGISSESVTALIPTFFGIPFTILGIVAQRERYRKHAMHGAAALALLGFIGTIGGFIKFFSLIAGGSVDRPEAVTVQALMAALCLVFLVLAVKSFIDARKSRKDNQ
jgi:uncharacterized membrane protein HdeD (DUF308 family)